MDGGREMEEPDGGREGEGGDERVVRGGTAAEEGETGGRGGARALKLCIISACPFTIDLRRLTIVSSSAPK